MDNYITKYNDKVKEVIKVTDDNIYDLDKNYGISKPFNVFDDYDKCAEYLVGSEIYWIVSHTRQITGIMAMWFIWQKMKG